MKLNDYIEKFKSVDMTGRTPIEVYEELLSIKAEYYWDTDDDCLDAYYSETGYEMINSDIREILKNKGWKAVWKYLHTIPEESIKDAHFIVDMDHLRPVNWNDVAELQRTMLTTLQSKFSQAPEKEQLSQALSVLSDTIRTVEKLIKKEKTSEAN